MPLKQRTHVINRIELNNNTLTKHVFNRVFKCINPPKNPNQTIIIIKHPNQINILIKHTSKEKHTNFIGK
jgi:hypothetical protein